MILDTSFLIDLLRKGDEQAKNKAEELDQKLEVKSITSISIMELWRGALRSANREHEKQKIEGLISSLMSYTFNELAAKKAAEIEENLRMSGEMIDLEDVMIAAIALVHHEKVLTRNVKHFERIKNLRVETY